MDLIFNIQRCLSAYGFNPPPVDFWILLHTFTVFTYWHVYPHLFCYPQDLPKTFKKFQKVPKSFFTFLNNFSPTGHLDFFGERPKIKLNSVSNILFERAKYAKNHLRVTLLEGEIIIHDHSWTFMTIEVNIFASDSCTWHLSVFKIIWVTCKRPRFWFLRKKRPKLSFSNKTAGYGSLYEPIEAAILIYLHIKYHHLIGWPVRTDIMVTTLFEMVFWADLALI